MRIVAGVNALACEFPWAVVVRVGSSLCGGSILDADTVITAGHCVSSPLQLLFLHNSAVASPSTIRVSYGSSSQQLMRSVSVTRVTVHPKFVLANTVRHLHTRHTLAISPRHPHEL
ncbi:hypothetical protein C0Q70_18512 [Pomacea canaliculata]|uniref:Peptidase S1 domain-containing protein n=1 Tax=Pomacea canaliculata TaxID=400727 RepID=A0A2T7NGS2_POMCA|nr:hypothetical protein C0Q70_18512 [Pomacea canaliculata]